MSCSSRLVSPTPLSAKWEPSTLSICGIKLGDSIGGLWCHVEVFASYFGERWSGEAFGEGGERGEHVRESLDSNSAIDRGRIHSGIPSQ